MMIGTQLVRELVETTILTGHLTGHDPVSLLLLASPESGKTSIVLERDCKSVIDMTDVSGRSLQVLVQSNPEVSHFVINDMVAVLSHKQSVNQYTLSMLNAMTEEGIRTVAIGGNVMPAPVKGKRGIIASLTLDLARDQRRWWNATGFASRVLPFCYCYDEKLVIRIKDYIETRSAAKSNEPKPFTVPAIKPTINLETIKASVRELSDRKAKELGEKGIRRLKQFRSLVAAHALWRSWKNKSANEQDVQFLMNIYHHISYTNPVILGFKFQDGKEAKKA